METPKYQIRESTEADCPTLLRLNLESVHFLSPLSLPQLRSLRAQAWYCHVIGIVNGFLLALREGADYDSINYQ
jgi:predicted GNAT superfamily acetyltransferase